MELGTSASAGGGDGGGGPALRWELGRVLSIIEVEAFQVIA